MDGANSMGIRGTPMFLIGALDAHRKLVSVKKTISGARSLDVFKSTIDSLLVSADNSTAGSRNAGNRDNAHNTAGQ